MKAALIPWLAPCALAVTALPVIIRAGDIVVRLVSGNLTEVCTVWSVSLLGVGRVRSPFRWAGVVSVHAVCPRSAGAGAGGRSRAGAALSSLNERERVI
jgi:hypothetical protein